jgi:hypothetical protein
MSSHSSLRRGQGLTSRFLNHEEEGLKRELTVQIALETTKKKILVRNRLLELVTVVKAQKFGYMNENHQLIAF